MNRKVISNSAKFKEDEIKCICRSFEIGLCSTSYVYFSSLINSSVLKIRMEVNFEAALYISGDRDNESFQLNEEENNKQSPNKKTIISEVNSYGCDNCGKVLTTKSGLKYHKHAVHKKTGKYHVCKLCENIYRTRSKLLIHNRTHTGEKSFICPECHRYFSDALGPRKHQKTHTRERPFVCDHCDKSYNDLSNLNRHKRTHSGQKPSSGTETLPVNNKQIGSKLSTNRKDKFICSFKNCEYEGKTIVLIKKHSSLHENPKLSCGQCKFITFTNRSLGRHMDSSHTFMKYQCDWPQCEYEGISDGFLKRHMKSHTNLSCDQCMFSTDSKKLFHCHMRKHKHTINARSYYCEYCEKVLETKTGLTLHQHLKHFKRDQMNEMINKQDENDKVYISIVPEAEKRLKLYLTENTASICNPESFNNYNGSKGNVEPVVLEAAKEEVNPEILGSLKNARLSKNISQDLYPNKVVLSSNYDISDLFPSPKDTPWNTFCFNNLNDNIPKSITLLNTFEKIPEILPSSKMSNINAFYCEYCGKVLPTKQSFKNHQDAVHNNVKYQCEKCPYRGFTINQHYIRQHGNKKYVCETCEYMTSIPRDLKCHMFNKHTIPSWTKRNVSKIDQMAVKFSTDNGTKYRCKKCSYSTHDPSHIYRHNIKHIKEK